MPNVPNPIARQHSSIPTSAQLRRGDERPQIPIISPSTATIAAGGQSAAKTAENRPRTSEVTVPPMAISPARRASISSAVDDMRDGIGRELATGTLRDEPEVFDTCSTTIASSGWLLPTAATALTGGRPSISGGSANACPHFQQRFTAPRSSSPHFEQCTAGTTVWLLILDF